MWAHLERNGQLDFVYFFHPTLINKLKITTRVANLNIKTKVPQVVFSFLLMSFIIWKSLSYWWQTELPIELLLKGLSLSIIVGSLLFLQNKKEKRLFDWLLFVTILFSAGILWFVSTSFNQKPPKQRKLQLIWKIKLPKRSIVWKNVEAQQKNILCVAMNLRQKVYAIDLKTGKLKWIFKVPHKMRPKIISRQQTLFLTTTHAVYALDVQTGKLKWRKEWVTHINKKQRSTERTITPAHYWLLGIRKNVLVFLLNSQQTLFAINSTNGKLLWKRKAQYVNSSSSLGVQDTLNTTYLRVNSNKDKKISYQPFTTLELKTGDVLWQKSIKGYNQEVRGEKELLFVRSFRKIYAFTPRKGKLVWKKDPTKDWDPKMVLLSLHKSLGPLVFGMGMVRTSFEKPHSYSLKLYAFKRTTGQLVWSKGYKEILQPPTSWKKQLIIVTKANIYAAVPETGVHLWKYNTGKRSEWIKNIVNDRIFYYQNNYLHALNVRTGKLQWKYPVQGGNCSHPFYKNGTFYFGDKDGNYYAVREIPKKASRPKQK